MDENTRPTQDTTADASKYVEDDEANVSPEEQAEYEAFMENGLSLIYDGEQVRPELVQALGAAKGGQQEEGAPNPAVLTLAQTAVSLVTKLDDSARQAGKPVSDDVLFHGGMSLVEELAEVAEAAGIHDYSEEEITGAFSQAIDMYREKAIADGRTDEETLKAQFNEINQAESEGRLGEVLPGLETGEPVQKG